MNIVLLGAPGAGKGSQAKKIVEHFGLVHISTGDIFRKNIKEQTELGKQVEAYLERGELVPDALTVQVVQDRLSQADCQKGWMLDGFPRTLGQAGILDQKQRIDLVLNLTVDFGVVEARLVSRRVCPACGLVYNTQTYAESVCVCGERLVHRADDQSETVKNRLAVYQAQTEPLIEYYEKAGCIKNIDGMGSVEDVWERTREVLGATRNFLRAMTCGC
ncbi:MAG: adenylate kinase [Firmicutes bacterium]|nr:adenylate kinase [Bacillota bacterium]